MANNVYGVGLRNVGSYQVAGSPYLTASVFDETEMLFRFPFVTKRILVHNTGSFDVQIYFQASPENKLILPAGKKIDMDAKCTSLRVSVASGEQAGIQILAEVTNIEVGRMYSFSGLEGL